MARRARLDGPSAAHHVMVRGVGGAPIFLDTDDRQDFISPLCPLLPECGARCFAWALLSNHAHLVIQTDAGALSRVMRRLDTGYAVRFNRRTERRGYVFMDRFRSRIVEDDADLVGLIRYVHRNPIEPGQVTSVEALATFPWSGHGALVGARPALPFEAVGAALSLAIQSSRNGELVAVASRDADRARSFAREHGIPWWHGSYQELLDDSGIDAVYIPLPNSLHAEWAVRAAEARKHNLCEKPLAVTAEAAAMVRAAERHGVLLMEAFMYRFHPRTEQVLAIVRAGALGELRAIRSVFTFRLTRPNNIRLSTQLGGGALMDVGCYCVNVSRTLAGAEPLGGQAWAAWGPTGVDLSAPASARI